MRTVELLCSPTLDTAVRGAWDRLAAAGLPSLARNTHPSNRPHLTLASVRDFPPGSYARLSALLDGALPLRVRLSEVTVLDGSAPLVWLVQPEPWLIALHAEVWAVLADADGRNPWHEPGRWRPHLSLALRFRDADQGLARAVVGSGHLIGAFLAARSYNSADRSTTSL